MAVFVDTSAFLAILNRDDLNHESARACWESLLQAQERIACTNYVIVETVSLMQRRLGMEAVNAFIHSVMPVLQIYWVEPPEHDAALQQLSTTGRRGFSLVDFTSFIVMRRLGLTTAFCYDSDFATQGFSIIPQQV
ncbi:MAG: PIN domain-containing protein [Armatimonadetes bacterium]|nr:PIN domain-containing protein [Armatimonadota bacterium]